MTFEDQLEEIYETARQQGVADVMERARNHAATEESDELFVDLYNAAVTLNRLIGVVTTQYQELARGLVDATDPDTVADSEVRYRVILAVGNALPFADEPSETTDDNQS